jgi:hypothetical protein
MDQNKDSSAPGQMQMGGLSQFGRHENILVKQTMRGCLQECLGCEAKSEYKVSDHDWSRQDARGFLATGAMEQENIYYALEESNCFLRCCLKDGRPLEMNISSGSEAGGNQIMKFTKPCGCPVMFQTQDQDGNTQDCPCCCFLPSFTATDADGNEFAKMNYACDINCMVPKFDYFENGQHIYRAKPPTCCGGCCVSCECKGRGCNAAMPFYFETPEGERILDGHDDDRANIPQITQVWAGWKKECCSTADTFTVKFPQGITPERKAGLLGLTFLIDLAWFEGHTPGR